MAKMKIVTDAMLDRANSIGRNTSNILEKQNMVTDLFKNMGKNFSGKIPGLMTQHMLAMDKEYQTMNGILTNYKDFLEDSARSYEWKDEELARFVESLGGSNKNSSASSNNNASTSNATTGDTPTTDTPQNTSAETADPVQPTNVINSSTPDLNSEAYNVNIPGVNKYISHQWYLDNGGTEFDVNGTKHINCLYYARARAMEANGMTEYKAYPDSGTSTEIRSNSVAYFHYANGSFAHAVYVERYDPDTQTVYFTEGNWGNTPDGEMKHCSLSEFQTRGGKGRHVANYDYYPPD